MRVDIVLTAQSVKPESVRGKICVVIDVLRASTTIVTALANGCAAVFPTETPEEAREIARRWGALLGGEREGLRIEGFDLGNSPLEYVPEKVRGRMIAFTTTNGTRAMRACAASDALVIASFLNGREVTRLLQEKQKDTLIVCAGTRGEPSLEDIVCGGMLIDSLGAKGMPETERAVALWNEHRNNLAAMMKTDSLHGRTLVQLGFERDIDFAAGLNEFDMVPVRRGDAIVRREDHG
ncbi:2-phosphosulfolactate phosphatase [Candidatus Poribacteria bacterium]|nr:2-phosphosulfolactate phosphatase [Candidatus Poribacteria bacterium]